MEKDQRIIKGNETKRHIINASMKIISEEGIEGLSAKKVADLSKISKSTIFHHYSSVEGILDEIFESMLSYLVEPVKTQKAPTLEDFLLFLGESIYSLSDEDKLTYSVLLNFYISCLHNKKYRSALIKAKEEMIDAIAVQLSRYTSRKKEYLRKVSEMMIMTLDGYGLHFLLDSDSKTFKEIWALQVKAWQALLE